MEQIRGLGIQLHIDDFGTGYSSLSCLHRFPLNGLKIDRSFVNNVAEKRDYAAVVQCHRLPRAQPGHPAGAEGVETADQVALLQALGCDQAQGYFFAKPLTPDAAAAYVSTRQLAAA